MEPCNIRLDSPHGPRASGGYCIVAPPEIPNVPPRHGDKTKSSSATGRGLRGRGADKREISSKSPASLFSAIYFGKVTKSTHQRAVVRGLQRRPAAHHADGGHRQNNVDRLHCACCVTNLYAGMFGRGAVWLQPFVGEGERTWCVSGV